MNLKELRDKFVELSGRLDLDATYTPDIDPDTGEEVQVRQEPVGADYFINLGMRFLETRLELLTDAVHVTKLSPGEYSIVVPDCRAIFSLAASNGREKVKIYRGREYEVHFNAAFNDPVEVPTSFYETAARTSPATQATAGGLTGFGDTVDAPLNLMSNSKMLLFNAPVISTLSIECYGKFFQRVLFNDVDENVLSVSYGSLIVMCALRMLEAHYRNTQGVQDYDKVINEEIFFLNADWVEHTSHNINQMEA